MPDLRFRTPRRVQKCPICNNHVPEGALVCEMCGTDLNTASVMLTSTVQPLSRTKWRGPGLGPVLRVLVGTLAVAAAVLALGQVPVVTARVPVVKSLSQRIEGTAAGAWTWGRQQVGAIKAKAQELVRARPTPAPQTATPEPGPAVVHPDPIPQPVAQPAPPPEPADPNPVAKAEPLYLAVSTNPPGAQVHLDGTKVGTTPVTIKSVKPGTYALKITHSGYVPVSKTVKVEARSVTVEVTLKAAPRSAVTPPTGAQTGVRRPLAIGEKAPQFALKDRLGVIHRVDITRGRKTVILFVWDVNDPPSRTAIKSLDAQSKTNPGTIAMVVVLTPDRTAVRNLVTAANLRLPLLFGTTEVARAYGIPANSIVTYVISERGVVERRQVTVTKSSGARP